MNNDTLVQMRSGKEYRLILSDEQVAQLIAHGDIGSKRVFIIAKTDQKEQRIPWNKFFPGCFLSTSEKAPKRQYESWERTPRTPKKVYVYASSHIGPVGSTGFYSGPLNKPMYPIAGLRL